MSTVEETHKSREYSVLISKRKKEENWPELTRCLNSADRLPLLDSSMFITFVLVPRMLNLRELMEKKQNTV